MPQQAAEQDQQYLELEAQVVQEAVAEDITQEQVLQEVQETKEVTLQAKEIMEALDNLATQLFQVVVAEQLLLVVLVVLEVLDQMNTQVMHLLLLQETLAILQAAAELAVVEVQEAAELVEVEQDQMVAEVMLLISLEVAAEAQADQDQAA